MKIRNLKSKNHNQLVLVIILLLALSLRFLSLNQSFWLDEAISAKVARFNPARIFQFLRNDFNPPLYYLIIAFWQNLFGNVSELILRTPSIIFSLGTIIITFKLGQEWLNSHAKLAILMLATSPLHIYYSQEARPYALAAFLFTLTTWLLLKALKNKKYWVLFSFSLLLLVFSHYQVWLAMPIFPLMLMLSSKNKRNLKKSWFYLGLSFLPTTIALFLYRPILLDQFNIGGQIDAGWKQVIGSLTAKNIGLIMIKFIIGRISLANQNHYMLVGGVLVLFYWGLVFLGTIKSLSKKNQAIFLPIIFFLPLLLGIIIAFKIPLLSYFRFLFLIPFFYLLISKGILTINSKKLRQIFFCLVIVINLACSILYLTKAQFQRENWRLAVDLLVETASGTPVFIHPKIDSAFTYYNRQNLRRIEPEEFGRYHQISLISYGLPIFDPEDKIREELRNKNFKLVWGDSFNQVGIEKWQKQ